jgi:hypothetical protein
MPVLEQSVDPLLLPLSATHLPRLVLLGVASWPLGQLGL